MKIDVIDLYKQKYKSAYLVHHKDNRKRVYLIGFDNSRKGMSYAAYLWENANNTFVPSGYEVDHINNDKTDDRIENLQLLSKHDNIIKYRKLHPAQYVELICPICNKRFMFLKRNINSHPNPCCSRNCGYDKLKLRKKEKFKIRIKIN